MQTGVEDGFARSCYAAPDRIVVATALTDLEFLAPEAIAQAEAARAELVFVHAIVPGEPEAKASYYNPLKADRDARLTLEVLSRHVRAREIACSAAVRHGDPAEVVEEILRERDCGRLMIGSRSTRAEKAAGLGKTARQLLMQTPIPVCALPAQTLNAKTETEKGKCRMEPLRSEGPKTILYPAGEQGPHPEGLRFASDLAQYFHAELILLQISKYEDSRSAMKPVSCSAGLWPRMRRMAGTDASVEGLLCAARETSAAMLVMEAPPSLTGSATIPATVEGLVAQAPCPVLTFPVLPTDHRHPDLRVLPGFHASSMTVSSMEVQ